MSLFTRTYLDLWTNNDGSLPLILMMAIMKDDKNMTVLMRLPPELVTLSG